MYYNSTTGVVPSPGMPATLLIQANTSSSAFQLETITLSCIDGNNATVWWNAPNLSIDFNFLSNNSLVGPNVGQNVLISPTYLDPNAVISGSASTMIVLVAWSGIAIPLGCASLRATLTDALGTQTMSSLAVAYPYKHLMFVPSIFFSVAGLTGLIIGLIQGVYRPFRKQDKNVVVNTAVGPGALSPDPPPSPSSPAPTAFTQPPDANGVMAHPLVKTAQTSVSSSSLSLVSADDGRSVSSSMDLLSRRKGSKGTGSIIDDPSCILGGISSTGYSQLSVPS
eukprot:gnl/Spiro4/18718_TR9999_c0_g1_i1.p1 gnl/Spiro4/18718_TR9999_c0_g1~~gnl/Spiro4/18718_TR9999_c0_g1_i1.p1  ORF type:complete len:281 (-),score=52.62 gnl/Spiro4/18718_TR9999_c0_g1_i1:16-858(-)